MGQSRTSPPCSRVAGSQPIALPRQQRAHSRPLTDGTGTTTITDDTQPSGTSRTSFASTSEPTCSGLTPRADGTWLNGERGLVQAPPLRVHDERVMLSGMSVEQVAEDVCLLTGRPGYRINQYLIRDVLIDSGTPAAARRLLRDIEGRTIVAHAITHAHPDHYGSSKALSRHPHLPFWCPSDDADALESRRLPHSELLLGRLIGLPPGPAGPPIARRLREGDEDAGFPDLGPQGPSPGDVY